MLRKTFHPTSPSFIALSPVAKRCCLALIAALLCLPRPGFADTEAAVNPPSLSLEQLLSFSDAMNIIRTHYVDEISDEELLQAALRGMVSSLDMHSRIMEPSQLQQQSDTNRGREAGIGAVIEINDSRLMIAQVIDQSPLDQAGVKPGAYIIRIDGTPVRGHPLTDSIRSLQGPVGSEVKLTVRSAIGSMSIVKLERAYVTVPSVEARLLAPSTAYLGLSQFHRGSPDEIRLKLEQLRSQQGQAGLDGVILDLRDNRGGTIVSAMAIADGFLQQGLVVHTQGRSAASELEYTATAGDWSQGLPLMVLINRNSASAAEILAGALKDNGRAVLVGERSFGKGSVQSLLELRDGHGLQLTTARYLTPSGHVIDGQGIEPDIALEDQGQNIDEPTEDAVLRAALKHLRHKG